MGAWALDPFCCLVSPAFATLVHHLSAIAFAVWSHHVFWFLCLPLFPTCLLVPALV